jgi:two-component system, NarL family, invasion response regulator UvrY
MNSKPPCALRIVLTDDHVSTRVGIKQILKEAFRRVVFGEAATACETLVLLQEHSWNLLILDITLPDQDGFDILREVRRRWPELPVLIYSAHPEEQFAAHAMRAEAAGYLTKERAPEELTLAVRKIVAGGKYLSPSLAVRLADATGDAATPAHETLSEREFQVFRLTAAGMTGKGIASRLSVSQKTVSTYRTRILRKLHFESVPALVQYAVRHGLV